MKKMAEGLEIASIEQNEVLKLSKNFNHSFHPELHYRDDGGTMHREMSILCCFSPLCMVSLKNAKLSSVSLKALKYLSNVQIAQNIKTANQNVCDLK